MFWNIEKASEFEPEFDALSEDVQDVLIAKIKLLEAEGPKLKRPHADKLKTSKHQKMKELRFTADEGVWRVAFIFDPTQKGILLVCRNKKGQNKKRFYKRLIKVADARYDRYLTAGQERDKD